MPKSYKRHHNAGPVPYPDQSGKYLTDEVVTGDEWEPFVALDYVVPVGDEAPAKVEAKPAKKPEAPKPAPAKVEAPAVTGWEAPAQPAVSEEGEGSLGSSDPREAQKVRRKKQAPQGEGQ